MSIKRWIGFVVLGLAWGAAQAQPDYIQAVEQARPDPETLAKAREKVKKHKALKIRDDIDAKLPHFHRRTEKKVTQGETFCQICHLPLPHQKSVRTRAFLNMHSRFVACATCHYRPQGKALDYLWLDYRSGRAVAGEGRLRTGTDTPASQPLDGWVKIAPFVENEPVVPLPQDPWAEATARRWRESGLEQRAELQARLHLPLEEQGPKCSDCHQEERPLLDLERLGVSREQARLVYRHMIPQFFGRYRDQDQKIRIIDITQ
ncbi:hypothetical protein MIN45_P1495 [Methylomarinovum tepidoasis]|uniref:Cytochrome c-552/4 domain-containing protein n=1 Tax=Methylomarinovum tepidoasis TaxID=2840183 RepID=A0AAU9CWQ8_9GAMM|nr:hypothetical protein [Methylomarinovum sp. IN45]BCX89125.1 hypothetical protein MIN45_P1495 [Methylomarinovum sp. IN45]